MVAEVFHLVQECGGQRLYNFIGLSVMAYYLMVATAPAITVQMRRNMKVKEFLPSETVSFIELPFLIDYFRRLGNVTF